MGHTSQEQIQDRIEKARKAVNVGGLYYHYKNPDHLYVIEFVGCLESTEEVCVGYRSLYGKGILWIRTVANFMEKIEVEGKKASRFKAL